MDVKKLKKISAELKKAVAMHSSQAKRIDAMLASMTGRKKKAPLKQQKLNKKY